MYLNKKSIAVLLSLSLGFDLFAFQSNSVCANALKPKTSEQKKSADLNEDIHVSDVFEFLQAVDNVPKWGKIILDNDINMLSLKVRLNNSMVVDLNGHTIKVGNESEGIVVENKITINQKKIVKQYPSSYVWDEKNHQVKEPFFGGDGYELKVVDYESAEQYDDDICVTIRNGKIVREAGKNGKDGIPNTWFKCSGETGETPNAPLILSSGNIYLSNLEIIGGDGGNGGNGAYYAGAHIPINGGCGADGGNGGNGGSAIDVLREEVNLIVEKNCKMVSGRAGKGGKGGESNPNYWFYRSKNGVDGSEGSINSEISYKYKK